VPILPKESSEPDIPPRSALPLLQLHLFWQQWQWLHRPIANPSTAR